jgi:hypothetical protein
MTESEVSRPLPSSGSLDATIIHHNSEFRRKPVPLSNSHSHRDVFSHNGQQLYYPVYKPRTYKPGRFLVGKVTNVRHHRDTSQPFEQTNTFETEKDHFTPQYAKHMEADTLEPMFRHSKHAFPAGLASSARSSAGKKPRVLEVQRDDKQSIGIPLLACVKYKGENELHDLPYHSPGAHSETTKRVHFADDDRIVGWTDEKIVHASRQRGDAADHTRLARKSLVAIGGLDGTSDYRDYQEHKPYRPTRRITASSDRLVEAHPEPNDSFEFVPMPSINVALSDSENEQNGPTHESNPPCLEVVEEPRRECLPLKKVSIWHAGYNSAAWRAPKEKKKDESNRTRLIGKESMKIQTMKGKGKKKKKVHISPTGAFIEMFGYGVAIALILMILGRLLQ